jgi:hypothetical protein
MTLFLIRMSLLLTSNRLRNIQVTTETTQTDRPAPISDVWPLPSGDPLIC